MRESYISAAYKAIVFIVFMSRIADLHFTIIYDFIATGNDPLFDDVKHVTAPIRMKAPL